VLLGNGQGAAAGEDETHGSVDIARGAILAVGRRARVSVAAVDSGGGLLGLHEAKLSHAPRDAVRRGRRPDVAGAGWKRCSSWRRVAQGGDRGK